MANTKKLAKVRTPQSPTGLSNFHLEKEITLFEERKRYSRHFPKVDRRSLRFLREERQARIKDGVW